MVIDKENTLKRIIDNGTVSSQFYVLMSISATIAIAGLLLNASSFIIGSMLISPLGGSIALLGLSLARLDMTLFKRGLECLVTGMLLILLISFLVTYFFPSKDITPEILVRTHPNIYDLLVSTIAGGALGYIMVREDFHTNAGVIIGVGIATSVVPPLATVGYGFAVPDYTIAKGAFVLFFSNISAIALGCSYIFRYFQLSESNRFVYYIFATFVVLVVLSFLYLHL
ncbi:MAG: DUF389 domain-containing protein [Alphaproteobacteria bacterium]|nr:MAG: DUF389 domain-containing protein [Alphaproteobacteria bacterium]